MWGVDLEFRPRKKEKKKKRRRIVMMIIMKTILSILNSKS
jgi:hypothetical protein